MTIVLIAPAHLQGTPDLRARTHYVWVWSKIEDHDAAVTDARLSLMAEMKWSKAIEETLDCVGMIGGFQVDVYNG